MNRKLKYYVPLAIYKDEKGWSYPLAHKHYKTATSAANSALEMAHKMLEWANNETKLASIQDKNGIYIDREEEIRFTLTEIMNKLYNRDVAQSESSVSISGGE